MPPTSSPKESAASSPMLRDLTRARPWYMIGLPNTSSRVGSMDHEALPCQVMSCYMMLWYVYLCSIAAEIFNVDSDGWCYDFPLFRSSYLFWFLSSYFCYIYFTLLPENAIFTLDSFLSLIHVLIFTSCFPHDRSIFNFSHLHI